LIRISFLADRPADCPVLVLPVAADAAADAGLPAPLGEVARAAAATARFTGEAGAIAEFHGAGENGAVTHVLLAGTGKGEVDKTGSALAARLLASGVTRAVVDARGLEAGAAARMAQAAALRSWHFHAYRTKLPAKQKATLEELVLVVDDVAAADAAWVPLRAAADGAAFARDLVVEPANIIYPESFVERARALAELGVEITVLDEAKMRELGMGALLGVSQGSAREARILVMKWDGTDGAKEPVAFVGKGVTFDTGGISIKPSAGMEDMKWDMGGAAAVAGTMLALAARKAKAHVIGVCGLVENMPDGNAQRPGDVVTSMNGQTIEVINTDAEGRLVLCDAVWWVQQTFKPKTVIDLATLTGAMVISLGHEHGGLFANDDGLADQLLAAGKASGELLWRMPLAPAYDQLIDSQIADIKNVGPREAGSITAAHFIGRFIEEGVKWAHLDIAGMVWTAKAGTWWEKGATGFGVRLLDRFVADALEG